jgi:general stress protein 26
MALKDEIFKVMGGEHVAAVATVGDGRPAVRFMLLSGMDDLTLIGATMKSFRKVTQLKKNPAAAISIWSGREFTDPYVVIESQAEVHEDPETKKKYWRPELEQYFQKPENPDYVVLKFLPQKIELYHDMTMDVWTK